jgi:hypothetical protein
MKHLHAAFLSPVPLSPLLTPYPSPDRKKLLSDEHIKELSQRGLASGIALTDGQPLHVQLSADVSSGGGAGRRRPISGADIYVSIRNALQNAQVRHLTERENGEPSPHQCW